MLDTSNHAKEATWHTRIDPQQHGLINTPRFSKRYNIDVVTARLKDSYSVCRSNPLFTCLSPNSPPKRVPPIDSTTTTGVLAAANGGVGGAPSSPSVDLDGEQKGEDTSGGVVHVDVDTLVRDAVMYSSPHLSTLFPRRT